MRILAFAGPSRPPQLAAGIEWRAPAAAGDLLALLADPPDRIVLIDGYFGEQPAPWHKEILLLLERGVTVIGAASMGALRAAELAPFGMIGIGAVFAAYQSGRLTADDEVAVLHAPAELGWRPVTEALVNIRATLLTAVRARIVTAAEARELLDTARMLNFRQRGWRAIIGMARLTGASDDRLAAWLPDHRIDLKVADATQAIAVARAWPARAPVSYPTPRTAFLRRLAAHAGVELPD